VVSRVCLTGHYSFAHEIGHILGARHNPEQDPRSQPYPYGHGFLDVARGWRTIMAYDDRDRCRGGTCAREMYWSNPNIEHQYFGVPTGSEDTQHNARVLNENVQRAARFRIRGS
jgi:hypothetical protein